MGEVNYNKTLNLPKTDFPMRAGLPKREPEMLKQFEEDRVYDKLMEKNEGKPLWILHDGPPYANGDIHIGTALNKIIKDIIVRFRNMSGWQSPYVPGWDTHGLPIELKAREKAGLENSLEINPIELRELCKEYALKYVNIQRDQFKRLGVIGDWDRPYLTISPEFERDQIKVFGKMALKGYIYKGLKPVYWCAECKTALAEAEIEYQDDMAYSVYVKFDVKDDKGKFKALGVDKDKVSFVIWTTTTWTLPANTAIAVNPKYNYSLVKVNGEHYVIAEELVDTVMKELDVKDYQTVATFKGRDLEYIVTKHPFLDRDSLVVLGNHVTLESGTGAVHIAPGHGIDDYNVSQNYEGVEILVPVDDKGFMTAEAGLNLEGLSTDDAGREIAKVLNKSGHLLATKRIVHQYPHCWRCKEPILFRATEQWFISVEDIKKDAVKEVEKVEWLPAWGKERMTSMVTERSDWVLSRQRTWGVPIPIFYCNDCEKPVIKKEFIDEVAELFGKEGSNAWYKYKADEILPKDSKCPHCSGTSFTKETDIMDVWFDAGSSHTGVLKARDYLKFPADLYMEGGDQFRGWFQSSLLTSVACYGEAPFKAILTHGWTVDGEGKKMSKSIGNTIEPQEVIDKYGADILRIWIASIDYTVDARISDNILVQLSESYRKIRNTARFILGNISDFEPKEHGVSEDKFKELDRWILMRLEELIADVWQAYEKYSFHDAFNKIHNFCVIDLSSFYLDILKDRLYVEKTDSDTRRAAQTVMHKLLSELTKMLAPILAFTTEEIWSYIPHNNEDDDASVLFNEFLKADKSKIDIELMKKWARIREISDDIKKELETARAAKEIGGSLDAKVILTIDKEKKELYDFITSVKDLLKDALIVSELEIKLGNTESVEGIEGLNTSVEKADGEKCARCWTYSRTVGQDGEHKDICGRCASVIS